MGITNVQRKNGKAWKKKPKVQRKTGKTVGGYSLAKLTTRAEKRGVPVESLLRPIRHSPEWLMEIMNQWNSELVQLRKDKVLAQLRKDEEVRIWL